LSQNGYGILVDDSQSTAQNPSHTYFTQGFFTVRLTTTGPGGTETIVKTDCIEVNNIHVDFTATPLQDCTR
jgi:FOG: PKD repeat